MSPPLPEQRKIAQILSTWDRGIATTEKLIDASKQQKKALMQQLLTGKKRLVDPETGKAFEGEWEEVKLSNIAKVSIGLVTTMTKHYVESGVPLIRNSDIKQNEIRKEKMIFLSESFASENEHRKLKVNDVVTVHTGEVGVSAVIEGDMAGCLGFATLNSRPNLNKVLPTYLSWYFNSDRFINWCISMSTGDGRQNLNLKDFVKAIVHLPELAEQQKITSVLTTADEEIKLLEAKLSYLKQEKKALMQQLLTGKRRVSLSS
ncbi:restriction endonuclease subunit S [Vibrio aestuarianus]|nr:restriction endonuclease subunit S [Vibrio aestuarianus]MDE1239701.1 restriction endonuclease subunit S [Vibrio aestuarianus]